MAPARAATGLALLAIPAAGYVFLAARGLQDHHRCLFSEPLGLAAALREEGAALLSLPGLAALLPWAGFALICAWQPGRATLWLWLVAAGLLLLPLGLQDLHHCDRKGTNSFLWLIAAALPAFVLALAALALAARQRNRR